MTTARAATEPTNFNFSEIDHLQGECFFPLALTFESVDEILKCDDSNESF